MKKKKEAKSSKKQVAQMAALLALGVSVGVSATDVQTMPSADGVMRKDLQPQDVKTAVKTEVTQPAETAKQTLQPVVLPKAMSGPPRP